MFLLFILSYKAAHFTLLRHHQPFPPDQYAVIVRAGTMKQTKLIGARARKNWTLEQAAERIGCTPNTLNRWELGKFSPSAFYRARLSEVYGVPWEVLDLGSD